MMQWISTNSNSLCIVDISSHWSSEGVQRLAARADEIWMVADPYPPRFNHHQALKNMELAIRWREMGWRVHFAANRYHRNRYLHDWLRAFPWKPDMIIPEWPVEDLHRFYAAGTIREFPSWIEKNEPHGLSKWIKNQTKKLVNSQN